MDKLLKEQKKLVVQLTQCQDMLKGSISALCSSCNRAKCICNVKSGKLAYRLTYKNKNQKTKIVYVPAHMLKEAKRRTGLFDKAREAIENIIDNNIEIFKQLSKGESAKNS